MDSVQRSFVVTDRGMESRCVQQIGHLVLSEEHRARSQTSLIQLLLHHIPEGLENICEKQAVFIRLKEKMALF